MASVEQIFSTAAGAAQTLGGAAQGGLALLAQLVEEAIEPPPNTREEGPPPPELRQAPPKVIECDGSPPAPDLFESLVIPGPTAKRSDAAAALSEGEKVHVWSKSRGIWIEDGVVQEISKVDVQILGEPIYKGSVFVVFNQGSNSKWVRPTDIQRLLRRPGASPTAQAAATGSPAAGAGTPMAPGTGYPAPADVAQDEVNPDDRTAELQAIHQAFQKDKRSYCDESFPPTKQGRVSRWCRPHEIGAHDDRILWRREDWQLFRGTPSADDVQQGELGDCWFLSSLAAMAEFQGGRLVQRLLPDQRQFSRAGAYLVRFWLGGRWRDVIVDDRLPCIGNGLGTYTQLAYCATRKCQLWASIIEKGFAKACGSYEALAGGEAEEALTVLTGWPCEAIQFEKEEFDADILWATVCTSRDAKFLMTVSTRSNKSRSEEDIRAAGLVPNHAYSLIDVFDVLDSRGDRLRLLKIRNPHAKDRWRGSWCETSHLWTPELRDQLGCQKATQAGMFFMCFGDFLRWFERCTICKVRSDGWHKVRMPTELPGGLGLPSSGWQLTVSETTECCLTVAQPQDRAKPGPLFRALNLGPIVVAGFVLVEASSSQKLSVAAVGHPRSRAVVSADCWLKPGVSYFLLPLSLHENTAMPVVFSCFSRKAVQIQEHTFSESAVLASWGAFIKSSDQSPDNFHGAKVYTAKSGGGMAENHSRGHFAAELTFNSIEDGKLLFSRRSGITKDWVAPGQAQILQVVLPQGSGGGWRSNQRYEMRFVRSSQALNTPDLGFGCAMLHKPFSLYAGQAKAGGQARDVLNKWLPW